MDVEEEENFDFENTIKKIRKNDPFRIEEQIEEAKEKLRQNLTLKASLNSDESAERMSKEAEKQLIQSNNIRIEDEGKTD